MPTSSRKKEKNYALQYFQGFLGRRTAVRNRTDNHRQNQTHTGADNGIIRCCRRVFNAHRRIRPDCEIRRRRRNGADYRFRIFALQRCNKGGQRKRLNGRYDGRNYRDGRGNYRGDTFRLSCRTFLKTAFKIDKF